MASPEKQAALEAFVVALAKWYAEMPLLPASEWGVHEPAVALSSIIEREKQPLPSRSQAGPTRAEGGLASAVQDLLDDLANGHREYWSAMRYLSERDLLEREKQPEGRMYLRAPEDVQVHCTDPAFNQPIRVGPITPDNPEPKRDTAEGLLEAVRYDLETAHRDEPTDGRGFTVEMAGRCFERLDKSLALIRAERERVERAIDEMNKYHTAHTISHECPWCRAIAILEGKGDA